MSSGLVFMSYSRRELAFVDDLVAGLEQEGHDIWLDYRDLVPGSPWAEQIDKGLVDASALVFVVSKESLSSEFVELEWKRVISLKKRVILAIFEAVPLPPELRDYEWVDFRASFKDGLANLNTLLKNEPVTPKMKPPEKGIRLPKTVWFTIIASLVVAFGTLFSIWTLYLPYYLFQLPNRILKRDFNFFHTQTALILYPFISLFSFSMWPEDLWGFGYGIFFLTLPFWLVTLYGIRSPKMRRWGKPIASKPQFSNILEVKDISTEPVNFVLDFAGEDQKYGHALRKELLAQNHVEVSNTEEADAALVIISPYKMTTDYDPKKLTVYPILIQDMDVSKLEEDLQRVQWIDFRQGIKKAHIFAKLMSEPQKLLSALGVVPLGGQTVLPPIVQAIVYTTTILTILIIGGVFKFFLQTFEAFADPSQFLDIISILGISSIGLLILNWRFTKSMISRKGRLVSLGGLLLTVGIFMVVNVGILGASSEVMDAAGVFEENSDSPLGLSLATAIYGPYVGLFVLGGMLLFHFKSLMRWFPTRPKKKAS